MRRYSIVGRDPPAEAELCAHALADGVPWPESEVGRYVLRANPLGPQVVRRRGARVHRCLVVTGRLVSRLPATLPSLAPRRAARPRRHRVLRRLLIDGTGVRLGRVPCLHVSLCRRSLADGVTVGTPRWRRRIYLGVIVGEV